MKQRHCTIVLITLFALVLQACGGPQPEVRIVEPHAIIEGKGIGEWTGEWWQWANVSYEGGHPVSDRNGQHCWKGQEGPVWFLAGSFSSDRTIRNCTLPAGKYVLIPIINFSWYPDEGEEATCEDVTAVVSASADAVTKLHFSINNRSLGNLQAYREAAPECFDLLARNTDLEGPLFPTAAEGYWVMLEPLAPGRYTIEFGAEVEDESFNQDIKYHLKVE